MMTFQWQPCQLSSTCWTLRGTLGRIHLQLYNAVMCGHRLDEAQMIMLFPLSLSGAAQRWFASLDPSRRRTWADLGQEFII